MKKLVCLYALVLTLFSCEQTRWIKTTDSVIIRMKARNDPQTRLLRLRVVNDNIFQVTAAPGNIFSVNESLCVTGAFPATPDFSVKQETDTLVVSTSEASARISLSTGQVVFFDGKNNIILKEKEGGGKSFTPVNVEGVNGFTVQQVFESDKDEAFYGLGQHQSDEFNYKNKNESLFQYNTKVSVPFLISSRNYGILWDNYSLTRFGDPRDYSPIGLFRLFDNDGSEGSLTETWYNIADDEKVVVVRKDSTLDYENIETVIDFPEEIEPEKSRVVWTGKIEPPESGLFNFKLYYAGYVKLFVDGKPVVPERWRTAWNPNTYKFALDLEKGSKYTFRLEWKPDGGVSYIGLKVLSPVTPGNQGNLTLTSEMGDQIDYYFIKGDNFDDVISGYRTLTGKAPIMPKWSFGYWQSRERYKSQTELIDVVKEYRNRNIPLDNIVLDWSYWPVDKWGSHEFDTNYFPDPTGMVKDVHKLNARIMISVWPKFYLNTEHFREFDSRGWMYRRAITDSVRDWIGKGYIGSFYDAYSKGARDLFWNQIEEHLYSKGFDAWWMDAPEPDILSNSSIRYRKLLSTPTALGPSTKYLNTYALVNAMAIYNGLRSADPEKRVFILTRSGFAGLQKYSAATWSGDIGTRWEDMKAQISAGLNYSLSGIPYWTMDIGGFCVEKRYTEAVEGSEDMEEWRELNTRWFQFGAFCPLFRSHGQYPFREIYNISPVDAPSYKSIVYYDRLRYYLMPYIYSLAGLTFFNDYTIMRAMVMDFGSDTNVRNIGDQYMFGPSLLVAPVYSYKARSRNVYLPAGSGWFDFNTGKYFDGGQYVVADAPYEKIPLFVKEGSIIPFGPGMQYSSEKQSDPITLYVYCGRDCAFTLYEDDGTSYNYGKGACNTIKFSYDEESGVLTIGDSFGEYNGMLKSRTFNVIWISRDKQAFFDPDTKPHLSVLYEGKKISVQGKKE